MSEDPHITVGEAFFKGHGLGNDYLVMEQGGQNALTAVDLFADALDGCEGVPGFGRSRVEAFQYRADVGVVFLKDIADARGGIANEHCTRPMKVVVKGCHDICPGYWPGYNLCGLDSRRPRRDIPLVQQVQPRWCPLTDDKRQPNAGILIVAEAPAKEEG